MHLRASAWLWFHYLSNAWSVRLTTFLVSLESGEDPHRAFDAAFIGLTQAQLFEGAESHLFRGAFSSQRVSLPVSVPGVQYRAMTDSEVHATLSRARAATGNWDAARLEANAAIALDANLPVAREAQLLTERDPATRLELARRYANDQPRRSTAALLLALNLPPGLERTAALEFAVNLDPHDEIALSELANARLAAGRRTEALELAKNAAAQAPYSLRALVAWAATLAADGQCQTAVAVLQRALDYARLPASSKRLHDLEERLQRYQRCEVAPVAAR
jgi:tetratricopeptide (TPR) repeat protein